MKLSLSICIPSNHRAVKQCLPMQPRASTAGLGYGSPVGRSVDKDYD